MKGRERRGEGKGWGGGRSSKVLWGTCAVSKEMTVGDAEGVTREG